MIEEIENSAEFKKLEQMITKIDDNEFTIQDAQDLRVSMKSVIHKLIQAGACDHSLYVMDTVQ